MKISPQVVKKLGEYIPSIWGSNPVFWPGDAKAQSSTFWANLPSQVQNERFRLNSDQTFGQGSIFHKFSYFEPKSSCQFRHKFGGSGSVLTEIGRGSLFQSLMELTQRVCFSIIREISLGSFCPAACFLVDGWTLTEHTNWTDEQLGWKSALFLQSFRSHL